MTNAKIESERAANPTVIGSLFQTVPGDDVARMLFR